MKKISLFVSILCLVMSACSSDDDGGNTITGDIVGTWNVTKLDLTGEIQAEVSGTPISSSVTGEGFDLDNSLVTFNESPSSIESEGTISMRLTYSLNGTELTEEIEDFEFLEGGTWELNGNTLIITEAGEETEVEILTLTDTELVIKVYEEETEIEDDEAITSTFVLEASFKRV
ncbi:lipocalin family protein [Cognatitamlana onchidii]|uniref:lipocalin family protein n=1 Tax=Cognatitamlana onchidii TaxID=2562860 RepID=UPI0010A6A803|nr:lipocalin family protein [Algibacter onchidii]